MIVTEQMIEAMSRLIDSATECKELMEKAKDDAEREMILEGLLEHAE